MKVYDSAEIVEDRKSGQLRVYLISGDKRVLDSTCDLRWDYADVDIDEIRDEIVRATKRFARRQESWFRSDPRIKWFDASDPAVVADLVTFFKSSLALP